MENLYGSFNGQNNYCAYISVEFFFFFCILFYYLEVSISTTCFKGFHTNHTTSWTPEIQSLSKMKSTKNFQSLLVHIFSSMSFVPFTADVFLVHVHENTVQAITVSELTQVYGEFTVPRMTEEKGDFLRCWLPQYFVMWKELFVICVKAPPPPPPRTCGLP